MKSRTTRGLEKVCVCVLCVCVCVCAGVLMFFMCFVRTSLTLSPSLQSKNTGFTKLIHACYGCTVKVIQDQLGLKP